MTVQDYYERYWTDTGYNPRCEDVDESLRCFFEHHVRRDDDCLDLGCGDGGRAGTYLTRHARSYVGVDVSAAAIKSAQDRGLDALQITDASTLPFHAESFDIVVCSEVLEHLFEPQQAAAEALRVLRPGGHLIVTVPNAAYWRDRLDSLFGIWQPGGDDRGRAEPWRSPHIRFFRPATLKRMLLDTGFDHVEVTGLASPLLGRVPLLRRFSRRPSAVARCGAHIWPSLLAGGVGAVARLDPPKSD